MKNSPLSFSIPHILVHFLQMTLNNSGFIYHIFPWYFIALFYQNSSYTHHSLFKVWNTVSYKNGILIQRNIWVLELGVSANSRSTINLDEVSLPWGLIWTVQDAKWGGRQTQLPSRSLLELHFVGYLLYYGMVNHNVIYHEKTSLFFSSWKWKWEKPLK